MIQKMTFTLMATLIVLASVGNVSAKELRIALVLDKGGKDDKSFNTAAYQGAMKAKQDLHAMVKYVEATDENAFDSLLRAFAQKDFDIIFAIGITQRDALKKVAAQFPQKHFAIVDAEVAAPNVRSLLFEEHQGSYLVGAAAALASKTGKVGFIGGMDIPLIRRFQWGYEAGAKKINPAIKVTSNFIGISGDAWNNPAKAKELAVTQYDSGVDVIFSPSGASTSGVFDAAEEKRKFAIGVDSNQNWVKPGFILTSMLKRVDVAVYKTCQEAAEGKFEAGIYHYGLASQGIDYAVDQYNEKILPESSRKKLDALKADILSGKIQVPDFYKKK
ncbi:BMP family ABC transporter substrate-binding protein [Bdellovibrionota bacterium FG-1]